MTFWEYVGCNVDTRARPRRGNCDESVVALDGRACRSPGRYDMAIRRTGGPGSFRVALHRAVVQKRDGGPKRRSAGVLVSQRGRWPSVVLLRSAHWQRAIRSGSGERFDRLCEKSLFDFSRTLAAAQGCERGRMIQTCD